MRPRQHAPAAGMPVRQPPPSPSLRLAQAGRAAAVPAVTVTGKSLRLLACRVCQAESAADRDGGHGDAGPGASRGPGPDSLSRSWCTASR